MEPWSILIIGILLFLAGIFVFFIFKVRSENGKKQQKNIIYPFSGYLSPSAKWTVNTGSGNPGVGKEPQNGLSLLTMGSSDEAPKPQIKCPVGTKVNIIGAFTEVNDPYGECSNQPDPILLSTCGIVNDYSSSPTCFSDTDCGTGMLCGSDKKCVPMTCSTNSDCAGSIAACGQNIGGSCSSDGECGTNGVCNGGICQVDPGKVACMACGPNGTCVTLPTCSNVVGGLNSTCSEGNNNCRVRDSSAYLARHCDGREDCLGVGDIWNPNKKDGPFGPLPCSISAESGDSKYTSLPIIPGWGGGQPNGSSSGESEPATFNQGYYVHGIYTCVPDNS